MAKRKLTEEQKQELVERLQKARAQKNPPEYKNVHPSVLQLKDDHPLSFVNVKKYLKTQRDLRSVLAYQVKKDTKGALAKLASCEGYIRYLDNYIRNGDFMGMFYGEYEEKPIDSVCLVKAYDSRTGEVKRNVGVYYPDIGMKYTKEMWKKDNT